MGRSTTSSCLKIITCGSDSAHQDDGDLDVPLESKSSSDKKGWSFRKRSSRHRVLSNNVASETTSSTNKGNSEPASLSLPAEDKPSVPEKISTFECNDIKPHLSTEADTKVSETVIVTKDESEVVPQVQLEESAIIVIQSAVRVFLARKEIIKRKNVVKLQAVVRGHLVRQHAVGTLRCVQAIVKMQILVRARQARKSQEGSWAKNNLEEAPVPKSTSTYISIDKLLSNKFACQLMESTPKNKPVKIKCDPLKSDSAWNWLERWMSVSSAPPPPKPETVPERVQGEKNESVTFPEKNRVTPDRVEAEINEILVSPEEDRVAFEGVVEMTDSKETTEPSESEENLITYEAGSFKFQEDLPNSHSKDTSEQLQSVNEGALDAKDTPLDTKSSLNSKECADSDTGSVQNSSTQSDSNPQKLPNVEDGQPDLSKRSMKRVASDELENEGKKTVFGSRKAGNPAFIAAQSKFKVLSSSANSNKSFTSQHQDGVVAANIDSTSSGVVSGTISKELEFTETSGLNYSKIQNGGSECGTELSVTSTLDSPDRFDNGVAEYRHEKEAPVEVEAQDPSSTKETTVEADGPSANPALEEPASNLSHPPVHQTEEPDDIQSEPVNPHVELKAEISASNMAPDLLSEGGGPAYRTSPEGSPRSHMTVPESQGTPSSQVSVKPGKSKTEKDSSNQKSKSHSASKKSPKVPGNGFNLRSSTEQLPSDQKNGKKRSSFGSTKPDQHDQEPGDSNSSHSSLPHFMQVTESARAKIQANSSPRSSPDVHEREYTKKRHSLPGASGRQGSPRIQRSMSQAQQGTKGNGGQAVHEKQWQR